MVSAGQTTSPSLPGKTTPSSSGSAGPTVPLAATAPQVGTLILSIRPRLRDLVGGLRLVVHTIPRVKVGTAGIPWFRRPMDLHPLEDRSGSRYSLLRVGVGVLRVTWETVERAGPPGSKLPATDQVEPGQGDLEAGQVLILTFLQVVVGFG